MLDRQNIINNMLQHIPKWMDIRKRYKTSTGGKYLTAIADELLLTNSIIEEYKKDFFLRNYESKELEIVDYVYKAVLGDVDIETISLLNPSLKITIDIKEFYSDSQLAYYDDGVLYIHEAIGTSLLNIEYRDVNYNMTAKLIKMHVWNAYDEFAAFFGLRRFTDETNESLAKRINGERLYPANNNEVGMKNLIRNTLTSFNEEIDFEDIVIEGQTPENLQKYYNDFERIIDHLCSINRDVYKDKIWNIDSWEYDFIQIDYIPHIWDIPIKDYVNGVGQLDDLKISLIKDIESTNVSLEVYEESSIELEEFTSINKTTKDVKLKLTKYLNTMKVNNLKLKLTAGNLYEITDKDITLSRYHTVDTVQQEYIQDVLHTDSPLFDIAIKDNTAAPINSRFKIKFKPRDDMHTFSINKCNVDGDNVLIEKDGFKFIDETLTYKYTKAYLRNTADFQTYTNSYDESNMGIAISDTVKAAVLTYDISSMQNEKLTYEYSCRSGIHTTGISYVNFIEKDNEYLPTGTPEDKIFSITDNVNDFSVTVTGNAMVYIKLGDEVITDTCTGTKTYKTMQYSSKQQLDVQITALSFDMKISELKSSKFSIDIYFNGGNLVKIANEYYIPNNVSTMTISMKTESQYSPILKYIYIGTSLKGLSYETPIIEASSLTRKIDIITEADVFITLVSDSGIEISESIFDRNIKYIGTSNLSYIKINLDKYLSIQNISSNVGTINLQNGLYYIYLQKDQEIDNVIVDGIRDTLVETIKLNKYFNINTVSGDKLYISSIENAFITVKNNKESIEKYIPSTSGNNIKYVVKNADEYNIAFELSDKSTHIGNTYDRSYLSMYITPKDKEYYVAYNNIKIYSPSVKDIDMVNNFRPILEDNRMMYYKIELEHDLFTASFQTDNDFYACNNFSCGKKSIWIKNKIDISKKMYGIESKTVHVNLKMNGQLATIPLRINITETESIDPKEYIIEAEESEVMYLTRDNTSLVDQNTKFVYSEYLYPDIDNFNKLKMSNINKINSVKIVNSNNTFTALEDDTYTLLRDEGLIIWREDIPLNNYKVVVEYEIKIPIYFKYPLSHMYESIKYNLNAYKQIYKKIYTNMTEDSKIPIDNIYNDKKYITRCSNPKYIGMVQNGSLLLSKTSSSSNIALKCGYYYFDGNEYYMFNNKYNDILNKNNFYEIKNASKSEDKFEIHMQSKNLIINSSMSSKRTDLIHVNDFNNNVFPGSSLLNKITACDTLNHIKSFAMSISLVDSRNGLGIKFEPNHRDAYAFIEITESLSDKECFISLFGYNDLKLFLYKEVMLDDYSLSKSNEMKFYKKILGTKTPNYYETPIIKESNKRYYLLIQGEGVLDDIIISDSSDYSYRYGLHTKNINKLNFNIIEKKTDNYSYDIEINNRSSINAYGADYTYDKYIRNSSNYDWALTPITSLNTREHFNKCTLNDVILNDYLVSTNDKATVLTYPIYVGDKDIIKDIHVSINDVLLESMSGLVTSVFTSSGVSGPYTKVKTYTDNMFNITGANVFNYIKLQIELPTSKVLNSIDVYVEHKETDKKAPLISNYPGELTTTLHDVHYTDTYKVSSIEIDDISSLTDVGFYIRAAKTNDNVFTDWKEIILNNNYELTEDIIFENYRFFEFKIKFKNTKGYLKFKKITLEAVIK